jgi:hypothetical protein
MGIQGVLHSHSTVVDLHQAQAIVVRRLDPSAVAAVKIRHDYAAFRFRRRQVESTHHRNVISQLWRWE